MYKEQQKDMLHFISCIFVLYQQLHLSVFQNSEHKTPSIVALWSFFDPGVNVGQIHDTIVQLQQDPLQLFRGLLFPFGEKRVEHREEHDVSQRNLRD